MKLCSWCANMPENACQVKVKPSRTAGIFFALFVSVSIILILGCHISLIYKILWLCVLLWMSIPLFRQCVIQNPISFQLVEDKKWIIFHNIATASEGILLPDSIATPYFILLRFQCTHKIQSYLVMRDALLEKEFKMLLLRLELTHF